MGKDGTSRIDLSVSDERVVDIKEQKKGRSLLEVDFDAEIV